MKVFISWSGEKSKKLAEILKKWLPGVIQAIRPFFTPDDIEKGARWNTEISKELEESSVGIICLTRANLQAPWLMFEAGALAKRIDRSRVVPMLFGVKPTDLPFVRQTLQTRAPSSPLLPPVFVHTLTLRLSHTIRRREPMR
jgi:hypothetical protein